MKISRNHVAILFIAALVYLGANIAPAQTIVPPAVSVYAGTGTAGDTGDGGQALSAEINVSSGAGGGIAVDSSGSVYFSDNEDAVVRKITTAGVISTVAGGGAPLAETMVLPPGPAIGFSLYSPTAITIANGSIYFSDQGIDVVSSAGTLTPDDVNIANDLASDSNGNVYGIYNNSAVYKYALGLPPAVIAGSLTSTGVSSGDGGPALNATFSSADSLAVDSSGNIYVSDSADNIVRKFAPGGNINTIAGNPNLVPPAHGTSGDGGPATQAPLQLVTTNSQIAVDGKGNLFIAEGTFDIRQVSPSGIIQTYAGNGNSGNFFGNNGPALNAVINPQFIAVDNSGNLYVANNGFGSVPQQLILKIVPQTTTTGTGPTSTPTITGVISAAANVAAVTPGGFASIYGTNLAPMGVSEGWASAFVGNALPTTLDNVSVTIDGKPAGVNFISPGQINVVVPDDTTVGPVNVVVMNSLGVSAPFSVSMTAYSPAFFTLDGTHVIAQSFPTYSLVAPTAFGSGAPAAAGSTVILYGTGFGPTNPPTPSNVLVAATAPLANTVSVTVGGMPATFLYAGINSIGLDQINITLPQGLPSGDQPIVATLGSTGSQVSTQTTAVIPIQ